MGRIFPILDRPRLVKSRILGRGRNRGDIADLETSVRASMTAEERMERLNIVVDKDEIWIGFILKPVEGMRKRRMKSPIRIRGDIPKMRGLTIDSNLRFPYGKMNNEDKVKDNLKKVKEYLERRGFDVETWALAQSVGIGDRGVSSHLHAVKPTSERDLYNDIHELNKVIERYYELWG